MANLWQFFGLPDPEGPAKKEGKKSSKPVAPKPAASTQELAKAIQAAKGITANRKIVIDNWRGPTTPDGDPFHDLAERVWQERSKKISQHPPQALRYIVPDENRYSLPLEGMATRLNQGDSLIVDLRSLIHMDAHQSACRRVLREMALEMGCVVLSLEEHDKLMLIPGVGVSVDMTKHELGQERALIL